MDPIASALSTLAPSAYSTQVLASTSPSPGVSSLLPAPDQVLLSASAQASPSATYGPYGQQAAPTVDPALAASMASDAAANAALGIAQPTANLSLDAGLVSLMQTDPTLAQEVTANAPVAAAAPAGSTPTPLAGAPAAAAVAPGAPLPAAAVAPSSAPALAPADDVSLATASLDSQESTALLSSLPAATSGSTSDTSSGTSDPTASLASLGGTLGALNTLGSATLGWLPGTSTPGSAFSGLA